MLSSIANFLYTNRILLFAGLIGFSVYMTADALVSMFPAMIFNFVHRIAAPVNGIGKRKNRGRVISAPLTITYKVGNMSKRITDPLWGQNINLDLLIDWDSFPSSEIMVFSVIAGALIGLGFAISPDGKVSIGPIIDWTVVSFLAAFSYIKVEYMARVRHLQKEFIEFLQRLQDALSSTGTLQLAFTQLQNTLLRDVAYHGSSAVSYKNHVLRRFVYHFRTLPSDEPNEYVLKRFLKEFSAYTEWSKQLLQIMEITMNIGQMSKMIENIRDSIQRIIVARDAKDMETLDKFVEMVSGANAIAMTGIFALVVIPLTKMLNMNPSSTMQQQQ